jgi:hypothetical protein
VRILSLVVCATLVSLAQTGTGNIQGTVKDAAGAVVPKAKVTVIHTATTRQYTSETNEVGFYLLPTLQSGAYQITVESSGMETWKGELTLVSGQSAQVDPVLKLGTTTTSITVAGDVTPLVTTNSPTIATVVERERIEQLPINGRFITTLLYMTTPGVESGSVPRVYGLRYATELLQDGAVLENREWQSIPARPPGLDTIAEFRSETNNSSEPHVLFLCVRRLSAPFRQHSQYRCSDCSVSPGRLQQSGRWSKPPLHNLRSDDDRFPVGASALPRKHNSNSPSKPASQVPV